MDQLAGSSVHLSHLSTLAGRSWKVSVEGFLDARIHPMLTRVHYTGNTIAFTNAFMGGISSYWISRKDHEHNVAKVRLLHGNDPNELLKSLVT
jgi:hypothetical protein